jgi:hypothetical protein
LAGRPGALPTGQALDQCRPRQTDVSRDIVQDSSERSYPEGRMARNGHVMFAAL